MAHRVEIIRMFIQHADQKICVTQEFCFVNESHVMRAGAKLVRYMYVNLVRQVRLENVVIES